MHVRTLPPQPAAGGAADGGAAAGGAAGGGGAAAATEVPHAGAASAAGADSGPLHTTWCSDWGMFLRKTFEKIWITCY